MRTASKRETLHEKQAGLCFYCDTPIPTPSTGVAEHVVPRSLKGKDGIVNRVLSCKECDRLKEDFASLAEVIEYANKLIRIFKRVEAFKANAVIPLVKHQPPKKPVATAFPVKHNPRAILPSPRDNRPIDHDLRYPFDKLDQFAYDCRKAGIEYDEKNRSQPAQ